MGNPRAAPKKKAEGPGSELHAAARAGDIRAVESICSSSPLAVNSRDKHSRTPLHLAAWSGHADIVSYLCKHKADARASAIDDTSAIHFASQKGHVEVVRTLHSHGASLNSITRKGMTPLHFAVQGSHHDLVKYLIRKGASLEAKNKSGETPLDLAKGEELRSLIDDCVKLLKNEDPMRTSKSNVIPSKLSDSEDDKKVQRDNSSDRSEFGIDGQEKRKGEFAQDDDPSKWKTRKVPLAHLLTEDDTEEEV